MQIGGQLCEKVLNLFFDLVYVFLSNPLRIIIIKTRKTAIFDIYHQSWISIFALSIYISISLYYCVLKISFVGKTRTARVTLAVTLLTITTQPSGICSNNFIILLRKVLVFKLFSQYFPCHCQKLNKQISLEYVRKLEYHMYYQDLLNYSKTWYNFSAKDELSHKLCSITFLVQVVKYN